MPTKLTQDELREAWKQAQETHCTFERPVLGWVRGPLKLIKEYAEYPDDRAWLEEMEELYGENSEQD